ncbi:putative bifunctional diguanylate cyclase/phosphodiesterase [Halioxenophilus sp. WMMB6]|uniref:putative bifunctional diguanylate cyclase/phosphodiesterase n=1 Tax=Halioxenophilus sp. WMMB6 TaxID=3073815 RepID=UPI00295E4696|nr:EAL domain-containing protein [Halioxenophilus sp. WMMB6]
MFSLFIPFIHLVSAAVLFAMWQADPKRRYLLWWGIAFVFMTISIALGRSALDPDFYASWPMMLLFASAITGLTYTLLKGSVHFRFDSGYQRVPLWGSAASVLLFLLTYSVGSVAYLHIYSAVAVSLAMCFMAWAVWAKNVWHRLAASVFVVRAVVSIGLAVVALALPSMRELSHAYGHLFLALTIVVSVLLLLLICFLRSQSDLNDHLAILTLSHGITTRLQNVTSVKELGSRTIPPFITEHGWTDGLMLQLASDHHYLKVVGLHGTIVRAENFLLDMELPLQGTLSGRAVSSRKVLIYQGAEDDLEAATRIGQVLGYTPQTIVAIPLIANNEACGSVLLVSNRQREISEQEMVLFEMISHSVGMSIANAQSLEELARQAKFDSLTGLGNRLAYHEYIARLGETQVLVMLLDMNRFKEVNDTFGHPVGDRLLKQLAQRITQALPASVAAVFRLSGDEFVVVVNQHNSSHSSGYYIDKLGSVFEARFEIDDLSLKATAAIGLVEALTSELDSHELLRCADIAMYQAKKTNATIAIYSKEADNEVRARVQLMASLSDALESNQFEMHYQPVVDLASGCCCAAESLVRWHHPSRGLLSAGHFVPFIEATDQIKPLTYRVIDLTLRDLRSWLDKGLDLKVSINLSARNLFDKKLPDYIQAKVREYKVPPTSIQFEITESALMTDPEISQAALAKLTLRGFTIALDDFGTGYSSLAYLAKIPFGLLKIDQSFVRDITHNPKHQAIVKATIEMSHNLQKPVVAEGIEQEAELEYLQSLGCDLAQGYLYGKPMPSSAFQAWLIGQNPASRLSRE